MLKRISLFCFFLLLLHDVEAKSSYQRIISLGPSITEIIYALGADDYLVGVTDYCVYPKEAQTKQSVGGFINPSLETIVALEPDLVILSPNSGTKQISERLESLGIDVAVASFYSVDEIGESIRTIGELTDSSKTRSEFDKFYDRIDFYRSRKSHPKKKVLLVRWYNPLTVASSSSLASELITLAGGENVIKAEGARYPSYSMEAVLQMEPDIVIDATNYGNLTDTQKKKANEFWNEWKALPAVQNKQVHILDSTYHYVPGLRTTWLLDDLHKIIHETQ